MHQACSKNFKGEVSADPKPFTNIIHWAECYTTEAKKISCTDEAITKFSNNLNKVFTVMLKLENALGYVNNNV